MGVRRSLQTSRGRQDGKPGVRAPLAIAMAAIGGDAAGAGCGSAQSSRSVEEAAELRASGPKSTNDGVAAAALRARPGGAWGGATSGREVCEVLERLQLSVRAHSASVGGLEFLPGAVASIGKRHPRRPGRGRARPGLSWDGVNPNPAVGMPWAGSSCSAGSTCSKSPCHPLGEMRSRWNPRQAGELPGALAGNCRFQGPVSSRNAMTLGAM
jgi:hypothetical protein